VNVWKHRLTTTAAPPFASRSTFQAYPIWPVKNPNALIRELMAGVLKPKATGLIYTVPRIVSDVRACPGAGFCVQPSIVATALLWT
jgi:hypothetical protein